MLNAAQNAVSTSSPLTVPTGQPTGAAPVHTLQIVGVFPLLGDVLPLLVDPGEEFALFGLALHKGYRYTETTPLSFLPKNQLQFFVKAILGRLQLLHILWANGLWSTTELCPTDDGPREAHELTELLRLLEFVLLECFPVPSTGEALPVGEEGGLKVGRWLIETQSALEAAVLKMLSSFPQNSTDFSFHHILLALLEKKPRIGGKAVPRLCGEMENFHFTGVGIFVADGERRAGDAATHFRIHDGTDTEVCVNKVCKSV